MAVVEPRRRRQGDEEMAPVGIPAGSFHREDARLVMATLWTELVPEHVAGSPGARAERVATLNHESFDHAVENEAVIVAPCHFLARLRVGPLPGPLGEAHKILNRLGSVF